MGDLNVSPASEFRQSFTRKLLRDVEALDVMLRENVFEKGLQRIGAEQEFCLVDADFQPAAEGYTLLKGLPAAFTTEIGKFNLEANLDPFLFDGEGLQKTEHQLHHLWNLMEQEARKHQLSPVLTGILPTIRHSHLDSSYMTPRERYAILSKAIHQMRGADFEINIQGADELIARLDTAMFEACNTSWQMHLQLAPETFCEQYNWAQWISAPVLAACANSPLLLGRELWHETRIALFQQSIDTRSSSNHLRNKLNRVGFGQRWLTGSPANIFKDQICRFPLVLAADIEEDALDALAAGRIPHLRAMRLHNGTVYSWNRPCYGISETGHPHLRIECRYVPAGPTLIDEMANFAFWAGLMNGMPEEYGTVCDTVLFQIAKANFYRAARSSLFSIFNWKGRQVPAPVLILEELLPIAEQGLYGIGMDSRQINRYLSIIERRVLTRENGAVWLTRNFRKMAHCYGTGVAVQELTREMQARQRSGIPVHEWDDVDCHNLYAIGNGRATVGRLMKTDLFTIGFEEPMELVRSIMAWKKIRHLPVEDDEGRLVGLVTATNLRDLPEEHSHLAAVDIMVSNLITVEEDTPLDEAAALLKKHAIGCLPVVKGDKLVGLLTDTDFRMLYGNY
ncbi:MAG: CBS domain-containing protein [Phaeodactylibacter sp.]|nr:CBS domain-containing protein [Phaeodactylibacter sp.]MCB9272545.1 CBS domain-containing protein [Lewinellaceae bacterium]